MGITGGHFTSAGSPLGSSVESAEIADGAVTLAKMADLAQDLFIVRTTASTGVPETATVTSAARTVLDDTTVAAMVDTLGGASATGTGGLVRATSPTLVTPALGTPASGVMTNVTGLTEAGQTLADNTTNDVSATKHGYAPKFPNNTTTFLRGDGTYAAPSAGALTRVGGNTTEATTTSTTVVDLLSATSLSIATSTPFMAVASMRKTSGHASAAHDGAKLNATTTRTTVAWSSGTDQAESAAWTYQASPILTNYTDGAKMESRAQSGQGAIGNYGLSGAQPVATITDVILTGLVINALNTMGADELHVYAFAVS